ncbi:LppU/SCO3897 family protein [Saccharothrix deserti]|uniref:LppU/SCO3897 family protein n=1 Tax=Saccharothrix deserti TaxID=2593674 RepID=UPI00131C1E11|nr:hypothetical protein [Saccharothrix deserti]
MSAFISRDPAFQEQMRTPPNKRRKVTKLGLVVLAVFVLGIGAVVYFVSRTSPGEGDCAEPRGKARERVEMVKVDCGSAQAVYRVAISASALSADCPEGTYYEDRGSRSRKTKRTNYKCFMLHVKEGDCLKANEYTGASLYTKVACGAGTTKVDKVVAAKADAKLCAETARAHVYTQPATTVCLSGS